MHFLLTFFQNKKRKESVVIITLSARSVAGAYAHYTENTLPVVPYARRLPVEMHAGEPEEQALFRALQKLGTDLIRNGAPALARTTGSGTANRVLVVLDSPWQETAIRIEKFEAASPFVFSKNMVTKRLSEIETTSPGKSIAEESILHTLLNGYETMSPYGKTAHRAELTILSSLLDEQLLRKATEIVRSIFHTSQVSSVSGPSLRYQAVRNVFQHDFDTYIIDATDLPAVSFALVRKGILIELISKQLSTEKPNWSTSFTRISAEIMQKNIIPQTLFLLAPESEILMLQNGLDTNFFKSISPGAKPPRIIPIFKNNLYGFIRQGVASSADLMLLLAVLFYQKKHLSQENSLVVN